MPWLVTEATNATLDNCLLEEMDAVEVSKGQPHHTKIDVWFGNTSLTVHSMVNLHIPGYQYNCVLKRWVLVKQKVNFIFVILLELDLIIL